MAKKQEYGNESITSLKGADRVRKRPAVIFGSDGVEGCAHSIFEIVSNSIDEARDGHGDTINVTRCKDRQRHRGGLWPRHARGLEQRRGTLQLGAAVLRDVRRRQVRRGRGQLRVQPGPERSGPVRHPVCFCTG